MMIGLEQEYAKMSAVELRHWWWNSLNGLMFSAIRTYADGTDISIVDAGCGTGGTMKRLMEKGYRHVQGIDLSDHAVHFCRERGLDVRREDIRNFAGLFAPGSVDVIICNDVICHLAEEDSAALINDFNACLKNGGIVIMNLPALGIFRGMHDRILRVARRYNRRKARLIFDRNAFSLTMLYWPFLAAPGILAIRLCQRALLRLNSDAVLRSDLYMPPAWLNNLLGRLTAFENRFFSWKPLGSSLFIVAKKITEHRQYQRPVRAARSRALNDFMS